MSRNIVAIATMGFVCAWQTGAQGSQQESEHPGADVYREHCASCHDQPNETRSPSLAALSQMTSDSLRLALTDGVMAEQGKMLNRRDLFTLIDYLAVKESDSDEWLATWMCADDNRDVDLSASPTLPRVGVDLESTRYLAADAAGLTSDQMPDLELAWAIGFPDTQALRASPVIVGKTMFYSPSPTGRIIAMDVTAPCVKWTYDAGIALRTSIAFGRAGADRNPALVVADRRGQVHVIDAKNGTRLWQADGRHSNAAGITGSPLLFENKVIVPVSSSGVGRGANPKYECCVEHGAVIALDAASGQKLWTYHTMPDATYTGKTNRLGVKLRGPSGAPIWSTPTIDAKRRLVYATTGQNTSLPATATSDAVIAIDIETGREKWVFQALANDVWIFGCRDDPRRSTPNCPSPDDSVLKDFDFGGAAVLTRRSNGRDVLLAGQKSGDVWALDPDTGELAWNTRIGEGTPLGGVHWGIATDGERVFVPINDPVSAWRGSKSRPGMYALDVDTGKILWEYTTSADCTGDRKERFDQCNRMYGFSAVPLVVDESVVAGSVDGKVYVFDAKSGEVQFEYDVLTDFSTINAYDGKGGTIDSQSIAAGSGMIFIGAGYAQFRQAPGNVLLAFKPRKD